MRNNILVSANLKYRCGADPVCINQPERMAEKLYE